MIALKFPTSQKPVAKTYFTIISALAKPYSLITQPKYITASFVFNH